MMEKRYVFFSPQTNPYKNLAYEKYLMETVEPGSCILYLWQNDRTVVCGCNQNCYEECNIKDLEDDGGHLVRRLSGGGAVYHDLQNLNFTFLANEAEYDLEKQMRVVIQAVNRFGLSAKKDGRNDIVIDGRKISGNAFYQCGEKRYHHGTMLVDVDKKAMERYLIVHPHKLSSKGVKSVESRVVNLKSLCPELSVPKLKQAFLHAFEEVYGGACSEIQEKDMDGERIKELKDQFASWEWNFGNNIPFTLEFSRAFAWGIVKVRLNVVHGVVQDAKVYSDAMDGNFIEQLGEAMKGKAYSYPELAQALELASDAEEQAMVDDLQAALKEELS